MLVACTHTLCTHRYDDGSSTGIRDVTNHKRKMSMKKIGLTVLSPATLSIPCKRLVDAVSVAPASPLALRKAIVKNYVKASHFDPVLHDDYDTFKGVFHHW